MTLLHKPVEVPGASDKDRREIPGCLGCDAPMSLKHLMLEIDDIWVTINPRLDKVTHTLCPKCQEEIVKNRLEDSLANGDFPYDFRG